MIHPVYHEPHIGFGAPKNRIWNRLTYWLANQAIVRKSILGYGKEFIQKRGLNLTANRINHLLVEELEVEYPIDSRLFQRPDYWPERAIISNFRERNKAKNYTPDASLMQFLKDNPYPIFISFGSMINAHPEQVGMDIIRVATKHQISIIVNTSWGGIVLPKELPHNLFCVEDIPYDFLFPLVRAVIHHGGSGTTHSAWRCDRPQAIIPHIGDQFFWNRTVAQSGKGVLGFPIKKWQYERFERLLLNLVSISSKPFKQSSDAVKT
jgi:UDP:flavonoid glycosyltransferase YjiC (YdhE family)